ncbi:sigma-70 family RNA polymerase sigma factor [Paremcibacter congregatus]|uniref:RNA polymerase sigma factor n=1 Tax=Paremcibacter congregatus TaxID=2043170 RepID=UPI0030EB5584|tara:strand:+ start:8742 stop:9320 length:579 start_codon:yes stop_codon:yes gene_type:complete
MRESNKTILEELYRDHSKRLVGYVYSFLRSENEAEEVAQEAFLKLHSVENPEVIISHKAFLYRIAHNLAMKTLRRRKIIKFDTGINMDEMEVESNEPPADQKVSSQQEYKLFCDAVATLPPKCRAAFTLRIIHKKPFKEVSQELNISISTAEKHVLKGMRDCQKYMEKAKKKSINLTKEPSLEGIEVKRKIV